MTKAEFKVKAIEVLDTITDEKELIPFVENKGCLAQRVLKQSEVGLFDILEIEKVIYLYNHLIPTDGHNIAPLSEIRAWVESL